MSFAEALKEAQGGGIDQATQSGGAEDSLPEPDEVTGGVADEEVEGEAAPQPEEAEDVLDEERELIEDEQQQEVEQLPPRDEVVVEFPRALEGGNVHYINAKASTLLFEHRPFTEGRFREVYSVERGQVPLGNEEKIVYDNPWRVVRWRRRMTEEGDEVRESNARLVTWSDGSQHLFIGSDTVFRVQTAGRRCVNDLFNNSPDTGNNTFFSPLDKMFTFSLLRQPKEVKTKLPDKKARRVKLVAGVSEKEEKARMAEEDKRMAKIALQKKRERIAREQSRAGMSTAFLEEGYEADDRERRPVRVGAAAEDEADEYDQDFIDDEEEGDKGKRRRYVDEGKILEAKTGGGPGGGGGGGGGRRGDKDELDDLELYEEDDGFINDNDDEDEGGGMVVASDDEDDD